MFLKQIRLTNFKCFDSFFLDFSAIDNANPIRKTTFLLGENGTGKSVLLQAIALVTAQKETINSLVTNPEEWIKAGKKFCEIEALILDETATSSSLKLRIDRPEKNKELVITFPESHADFSAKTFSFFVAGYGVSRRYNNGNETFIKKPQKKVNSAIQRLQTLFFSDAALISLNDWVAKNDAANFKKLKSVLSNLPMDDIQFKGLDKKTSRLIFTSPEGDLALEQLSDGYQNMIAWISDLSCSIIDTFKDLKDPMEADGLLLLDEVDLHLHPKWHRLIHAFLQEKFPNFQIIATTHSPSTAQQAEERELYALRRENSQIVLVPFKGNPSNMLLHQILMSPVFGLETDESLKVESAKQEIREASLSKSSIAEQAAAIDKNAEVLENINMNIRSNSLLDIGDMDLLQAINTELAKTNIEPGA